MGGTRYYWLPTDIYHFLNCATRLLLAYPSVTTLMLLVLANPTVTTVGGLNCYSFYLAGNTSLLTFATHASFSTAFSRATLSFYLFFTIATGIAACVLLPSVYDTPLF